MDANEFIQKAVRLSINKEIRSARKARLSALAQPKAEKKTEDDDGDFEKLKELDTSGE